MTDLYLLITDVNSDDSVNNCILYTKRLLVKKNMC